MSTQVAPEFEPSRRALPDYLAARKINEYAYCPRLFYFEQVEGVFVHNEHTAEGSAQHKSVDKEGGSAPAPGNASAEPAIVRSITLSSEKHRVIAKLDLAEFAADLAGEQLGLFDSARKIPKKSPARETRLLVAPRVDR